DPLHTGGGRLADAMLTDAPGLGPLAALVADPSVTDVLVNGPAEVWVERGHGLQPVASVGVTDGDELRRLAVRLAAAGGRRLDDASPCVDASLPDGTRLHAVLPPVAVRGPYLSLRTFRPKGFTLDQLVTSGTVPDEVAPVLTAIVAARLPFLITGGTGSGKSTLLNTLLGLSDPGERIVVVEDAAELA